MTEIFELYNGYELPSLFYGTYKVIDELIVCLDAAFGAGYRGIDTASFYHNERRLGAALKQLMAKHSLERQQLFITSKLPPKLYGANAATKACQISLNALESGYLDLYMIHWPGIQNTPQVPTTDAQGYIRDVRRNSWMALEAMVLKDRASSHELAETNRGAETTIEGSGAYRFIRSIGVCNYTPRHVEELASYCTIPPAVIQYECHPLLGSNGAEHALRRLCTRLFPMQPIHFQAHSALAGGSQALLGNEVLNEMANEIRRSVAQISIRWALQKGHSVVVKSVKPRHIVENSRVFDWSLTTETVNRIDSLARNIRLCWDPTNVP